MALSISDTFDKRRFLLDEARLRKVVELITKRLNKGESTTKIEYEVTREDRSEYTTSDIDEIVERQQYRFDPN